MNRYTPKYKFYGLIDLKWILKIINFTSTVVCMSNYCISLNEPHVPLHHSPPPPDPCFHYTTNIAIYRLKLPRWSEPFAVGLADTLLDVPFDILGIKFLWWTWHDTDPNIFDRSLSVPITRCVSTYFEWLA